jgi:Asp-tRNA(Asn)/Glu-tRNA(Gln) amidotransferase A subunit family amidase
MLSELVDLVRRREVSARELVERSLVRVERHNPALNAVVALRAEEALLEADCLDTALARGLETGPLAGIPVLVKDMENVTGMRTTHGSLLRQDAAPACHDDVVPRRLRAAGAILVGKTNMPEFAFEGYTDNRLFGATRNPWAPDWTPGGSSGGSAAAMAAGMAPIATATDGGGSVRIPAAFCGLTGHKPTNGLIGRQPIPSWIDYSTSGPLGYSITDLRLQLSVEVGPVAGDPSALPTSAASTQEVPKRLLAAPRTVDWGPLPPALQTLFDTALERLEYNLGLPLELISPRQVTGAGNADLDWYTVVATEQAHELGRATIEANAEHFDPFFRRFIERGLETSIEDYLAARRRRFEYVHDLDELLGCDKVLVTPTMAIEGLLADGRAPGEKRPGSPVDACNTILANTTGHPALSVPAGRSPNGVPFGLQFIGPRFRDDLVLNLGSFWEMSQPWVAVAPGYEAFIDTSHWPVPGNSMPGSTTGTV